MLMDDKELIKSILDEIRIIREEMTTMKIINVKQEQNLREHMRRSDALEENLSLLRKDIKPLQKHVSMVDGVIRVIGVLSLLATIGVGIVEVLKHLN